MGSHKTKKEKSEGKLRRRLLAEIENRRLLKVCNMMTMMQRRADNDLLDKPERIHNMDESGVQLNNKLGKVVAMKGAKIVNSVTSAKKGETMAVVACCNAIGNFLPPVKPKFENGLPLGSKVYMNKKSAYINIDLFYKWLTEHFIALKPQVKVLLILDGHSSKKEFLEILILSGYHRLPRERVSLIARFMSRNRFLDIKRNLHLVDNSLASTLNDKIFKVRPLEECLNQKFCQNGVIHENISIDESMIKYYGHHHMVIKTG
uniref:SFRICE_026838 n=1 Tax=Spodoptera frugiperda TaxID=7108 RepID=A0A2H1WMP4_SPOFR